MGALNVFRVAGDISHVLSKAILIWAIHWNRSAEGVSLITQALYLLVFCTRYLDLFWTPIFSSDFLYLWLFLFKVFYIASSAYIVFLMVSVYARTREREKAWRFGMYCLGGAAAVALPLTAVFQHGPITGKEGTPMYYHPFIFSEILWTFSIILESTCILPQLLLLRQTTVPTVLDSYYLLTLGSYRAFYILNWIWRLASPAERHFDPIAVVFGIVQTALYVDFAWVYYTRQRVKLRAGGVVDSEDLERGWLVGRFVKHHDLDDGEDDGASDPHARRGNNGSRVGGGAKNQKWGPRGISVSADEPEGANEDEEARRPLTDPTAFEDDLTDDEGAPPPPATASRTESGSGSSSSKAGSGSGSVAGVSNGAEWRDEDYDDDADADADGRGLGRK